MIVFPIWFVLVLLAIIYGPFLIGAGWLASFYWRRVRLLELLLLVGYFGLAVGWFLLVTRN